MKRKIREQEETAEEGVVRKEKKSNKKKKKTTDVGAANNVKTEKETEEVCEDAVAEKRNKKKRKNKVKDSAECAADTEVKTGENDDGTKNVMEEAAEPVKEKKPKKKKEKKKLKAEGTSKTKEDGNRGWTMSLEYLKCWSERRDEWKFQKARQVWLLQNMYDREKVSDSDFSVLLKYLEGLQGVAREITTQKAEDVVRQGLSDDDKVNRAREVVQILS